MQPARSDAKAAERKSEIRNPKPAETRNKSEIRISKAPKGLTCRDPGVVVSGGNGATFIRNLDFSPSCDSLDGRRLNKYVHLLTDKQWKRIILEAVNNLKHARIHALGAVAGE